MWARKWKRIPIQLKLEDFVHQHRYRTSSLSCSSGRRPLGGVGIPWPWLERTFAAADHDAIYLLADGTVPHHRISLP